MENIQKNQQVTGKLRLEVLLAALSTAADEKTRLSRFQVDEIFHLILSEIPYAYQVVTPLLAEVLLDDSPHASSDLSLNRVVVDLGHAMFNPIQKEELGQLIEAYIAVRKTTQSEYATMILQQILSEDSFKPFPPSSHEALRELAHSITENVINEKQLRKVPAYTPKPLTDIIRPVVYSKLHKLELDKLKFNQLVPFRQFVSAVTNDSYERIQDTEKLLIILQEKESAYNIFRETLNKKVPVGDNLEKFHNLLKFEQADKNLKTEMLNKHLDTFLKPGSLKTALGYLAHHLRIRFNEKLRRLLFDKDINKDTYQSEETIKNSHDNEYAKVEYDVIAIKNLMAEVLAIQKNFKKNILHTFTGKKFFAFIEDGLVISLLGNVVPKIDPVTGKKIGVRDAGYPKMSLPEMYLTMSKRLNAIMSGVKGVFSEKLKAQIQNAIQNINVAETQLIGLTDEELEQRRIDAARALEQELAEKAALAAAKEAADALAAKEAAEAQAEKERALLEAARKKEESIIEKSQAASEPAISEATADKVEKASLKMDENFEPAEPKPLTIDDILAAEELKQAKKSQEHVEPMTLAIDETFEADDLTHTEATQERVEPKPLAIDESFEAEEPTLTQASQERVEPKPLAIDESFEAEEPTLTETSQERVEPKPLVIDESFDTEEPTLTEGSPERVEPKPLAIDESFEAEEPTFTDGSQERVEPKPLAIDESFEAEEPTPTESTQERVSPKPLQIDDSFEDEEPTTTAGAKPLLVDIDFDAEDPLYANEKVVPKPLVIDFDTDIPFTEEPAQKVEPKPLIIEDVEFEPDVPPMNSTPDHAENDMGAEIMKNYELGDLKQNVEKAWKFMVKVNSDASTEAGGIDIPSDNEVRLYVICDLIQQVAQIDPNQLTDSKKQILQDTKHKLMDALEDPLEDNHWSFFEGIRRDNIDRTIASLQ